MDDGGSVLVEALSRLVPPGDRPFDARERALIAALERDAIAVGAQTDLHHRGDRFAHVYVVREGWLYSHCTAPGGRRQIVRLHLRGDIVGMADRAFGRATASLRSATGARLCPVPAEALDAILTGSPRLSALLFAAGLRDQAAAMDRLAATGRTTARARIALFLLDTLHRLRAIDPAVTDTFSMPLNQGEIGDATALTNVTVSKTLMELQLAKMIDRREGAITLRRIDLLSRLCGYSDRDRDGARDLSWLPPPP